MTHYLYAHMEISSKSFAEVMYKMPFIYVHKKRCLLYKMEVGYKILGSSRLQKTKNTLNLIFDISSHC